MHLRLLPTFPGLLLRAIAVAAACASLAHAADGPGLFDSIGKLLAPAPAAPAPTASNRALAVAPTGQGRRIALVIGNGDYQHPENLPTLANPTHDAEDIAEALRGFGFEVIERRNQTLEAMNQTIAEFGSRIGGSEAALFYFAGHGIQVKNQNYLMPVNAKVESEAAVPYQGVDVNRILDEMDNGKSSANIVMLDACRNNPISGKFRSGKSRGLASPGSVPRGTVIVYATDPGNTAADGDGRNGLFTAGLLTAFKGKELTLDDVLTVASAEVERASGNTQTPYVNGPKTLQKTFHFRVTVDPGRGEIEKTFWTSIEHSTDAADFEAYLRKYPKGSYRALAENQIKRLKVSQQPAPAPEAATKPAPIAVSPAPTLAPPVKAEVVARPEDPETSFWNEVKASGAREYLDAYLKQYPRGKFLALAKIELKKLDDKEKAERAKEEAEKKAALAREEAERKAAAERERQAQVQAEKEAWERAKGDNTLAAYAGYLDSWPKGRYAALAEAGKQRAQKDEALREKQESARREHEAREAERQRLAAERDAAERAKQEQARLAKEAAEMRPGKVFKDCADCPEMVILPAGSFEMGSPATETGRDTDEGPQHRVSIRSFAAGKFEITRGQFAAFIKDSGHDAGNECYTVDGGKWEKRSGRNWQNPGYSQGDSHPAVCVNWGDANAYVAWLSRKTGKNYRLLSEAEWEYAARAGTTTARYWGESPDQACGYANVADQIAKNQVPGASGWTVHNCTDGHAYTAPTGSFKPNAFGLYDMIGNAWEWTEDCSNGSYNGAPSDGSAWTSGGCGQRVLRGGSWINSPQIARAALRFRYVTSIRFNFNGFRPARMLP